MVNAQRTGRWWNLKKFGGPWLALHLIRTLQLDSFLEKPIPEGREHVPWDVCSLILVIARLLEPSSELFIAEQWYPTAALPDLLGVTEERVDDNRLYRALDQLLPHKEALEVHLKKRLGAYIQLTEAEAAFRIHKSDLSIRPIWHQKEDRVLAHIFVCFLAYALCKTLGQLCDTAGLGSETRRVLCELSEIRSMDVVLPTRSGPEIRTRCISKPSDHQQILLEKLRLKLPSRIIQKKM